MDKLEIKVEGCVNKFDLFKFNKIEKLLNSFTIDTGSGGLWNDTVNDFILNLSLRFNLGCYKAPFWFKKTICFSEIKTMI